MAYKKKEIFEKAKIVIVEKKLFFIEDIVSFLPCTKPTFYQFFPPHSNELDELKELLETNRTELKVSMRSKWYKSNAPALQMALMKLIATDDELRRLSMNHNINQTTIIEPELDNPVITHETSPEIKAKLKELRDAIEKANPSSTNNSDIASK